jgi:hypothetical protein
MNLTVALLGPGNCLFKSTMKDYGSAGATQNVEFLQDIRGRDKGQGYLYLYSFAVGLAALSALLLFSSNIVGGDPRYTVLEDPGYVDWLKTLSSPIGDGVSYESSSNALLPAALPTSTAAGNLQGVDFAAETFPLDEEFASSDPPVGMYIPQAICRFSGCYGGGNPQAYTIGPSSVDEGELPDTRSSILCTGVPTTATDQDLTRVLNGLSATSSALLRSRPGGDGRIMAVATFAQPATAARAARALDSKSPFGASGPLYCVPMDTTIASTLAVPPTEDGPAPEQDEFPGVHLNSIDPDITARVSDVFDKKPCDCDDDNK